MSNTFTTPTPCAACRQWKCACESELAPAPVNQPAIELDKGVVQELVTRCLLEVGAPSAAQVALLPSTDQVVALIEAKLPSDSDIKAIAEACQRSEDAVRALIQTELNRLDTLSSETVQTISKSVAQQCFQSLIVDYVTSSQLIEAIRNHTTDTPHLSKVEVELLSKSVAQECIGKLEILDQSQVESLSKQQAQRCIDAFPFGRLVADALQVSGFQTAAQVQSTAKSQAQVCIEDLFIPGKELVEAWAKAVAIQCYNALTEGQYTPSEQELITLIKSTTFDCLKELIGEETPPDGNTRVSAVSLFCDSESNFRIQLLQDDNTIQEASVSLSKLQQAPNLIQSFTGFCDSQGLLTLGISQSLGVDYQLPVDLKKFLPVEKPGVSVCYSHGGRTYEPDSTGKITLQDAMKVELWGGGYRHVGYIEADECRQIPYAGPTQADIEAIAEKVLQDSASDAEPPPEPELDKQAVIDCVRSVADTLCVQSLTTNINSSTGEVRVEITDQCGTRADSFFFPVDPQGNNGISAEQSKLIALQCINDSVKGVVLQCIAAAGGIPSPNDINQLIRDYVSQNQQDFCVRSVSVDFDADTRQLSFSITDQCGQKSDAASIPVSAVGGVSAEEVKRIAEECIEDNAPTDNGGLSAEEVKRIAERCIEDNAPTDTGGLSPEDAKGIAQECINDPDNNGRFCNVEVSTRLVGTTLQTSVRDGCGTQTDVVNLADLRTSYCLGGVEMGLQGSTLSLSIAQDNCPAAQTSVVLPFDSNGDPVECCNTSFSPTDFDPETCIVTGQLNQSSGDSVAISIPMERMFSSELVLGEDGCTLYNVLRLGNKEIFRANAPIDKTCCLKFCVTYGATTTETVEVNVASGFDVSWTAEDGTTVNQGRANAGAVSAALPEGNYEIEVCLRNACERGSPPAFSSALPTAKNDCGC